MCFFSFPPRPFGPNGNSFQVTPIKNGLRMRGNYKNSHDCPVLSVCSGSIYYDIEMTQRVMVTGDGKHHTGVHVSVHSTLYPSLTVRLVPKQGAGPLIPIELIHIDGKFSGAGLYVKSHKENFVTLFSTQ